MITYTNSKKMDTNILLSDGALLQKGIYCVVRQLSSGKCSNTYVVRNMTIDELFVMKEFFISGVNTRQGQEVTVGLSENQSLYYNQLEKFKKEALRLRRFNNPHVIKVHDLFEENGTLYYIVDYIKGMSLAEQLKLKGQPMSEQQCWHILSQLLTALKEIHSSRILHLDIKPSNIMLDQDGNPILIDFGASKLFSSDEYSISPTLCYTSLYAPVEQKDLAFDKFGPWTDFYALGATLYYIQTLQYPPSHDDDPLTFPANMSQRMQDLILWMMEPQRNSRPQSVGDIEHRIHQTEIYDSDRIAPKCAIPDDCFCDEKQADILDDSCYTDIDIEPQAAIPDDDDYDICPCPPPYITESSAKPSQRSSSNILHVPEKKGLIKRLGSLFRKNGDSVNSAIFAPATISKGDDMMIQVYIYKDEETDKIVLDAVSADKKATKRRYAPLNFNLKKEDKVSIHLNIKNISLSDNYKELIWQGKYTNCSFFVSVPEDYGKNIISGEVILSVNDLLLGQLDFIINVTDDVSEQESAEIITKLYKKVFISYSHKDTETARVIAESYKAMETVEYFYDRHSLSPGDLYEKKIFQFIDDCDLFILCWSQNAKASEWVNKERQRALSGAISEPPKIRLYPINIKPHAAPPEDMIDFLHFTDYNV